MTFKAAATRIALVDDDQQVLEGLRALIQAAPACKLIATCATAEEALLLPIDEIDVILMDIGLPGMSGIECTRKLKKTAPHLQVMMLTVFEDHDRIFQSLASGASGYILKNTPPARLLEAITDLHRGGSPMSSQIARKVVAAFQTPATSPAESATPLSSRETQIVQLLARGHLYKEIAADLSISVETVRTHIHNIYEKLHVRSRTEAVMKLFGSRLF